MAGEACRECPYANECEEGEGLLAGAAHLAADALALLREQEAVEPEWIKGTPFCGNCGHRLEKKHRNMDGINCPECGRAVKWNE